MFDLSKETDAIIGGVIAIILFCFLIANMIYWNSIVNEINNSLLSPSTITQISVVSKTTAQVLMVLSGVLAFICFIYLIYNVYRWWAAGTQRALIAKAVAQAAVAAKEKVAVAATVVKDKATVVANAIDKKVIAATKETKKKVTFVDPKAEQPKQTQKKVKEATVCVPEVITDCSQCKPRFGSFLPGNVCQPKEEFANQNSIDELTAERQAIAFEAKKEKALAINEQAEKISQINNAAAAREILARQNNNEREVANVEADRKARITTVNNQTKDRLNIIESQSLQKQAESLLTELGEDGQLRRVPGSALDPFGQRGPANVRPRTLPPATTSLSANSEKALASASIVDPMFNSTDENTLPPINASTRSGVTRRQVEPQNLRNVLSPPPLAELGTTRIPVAAPATFGSNGVSFVAKPSSNTTTFIPTN